MQLTPTTLRRAVTAALVIGIMGGAWPTAAATYYVAPGGTGDGSAASPWGALKNAVSSGSPVQAGDTIVVKTGTYELAAAVSFQKSGSPDAPITLVAEPGVVLNVTASSIDDGALDLYKVHDWIIDGFRLNESSRYGIALHGCTNITIQSCYVYRAQASGIIVNVSNWGTDDVYPVPQNWNIKILGNTIDAANWNLGDNEAISLWATDGFEIAGNTVAHCRHEGIDVKTGARNGTVHHNTIVDDYDLWPGTGMGVYVDGWHYETYNIDIYENVIHDSEEGFEVQCEDCNKPGTTGSVHHIRYFNNVVYRNTDIQSSGWKGRGMSFFADEGSHPVHDIHIFNNTFVGNQRLGIHVDNPDIQNLFIRNNIIVNNGPVDVQIDRAGSVTVENNIVSKPVKSSIGAALSASNNVVADPLFVSAAGCDYRLQSGSPAIDKAGPSDVAATDCDGKARPIGAAADLGAYEYGAGGGLDGGGSVGGTTGRGGTTGTGGASPAGTGGRGGSGGRGGGLGGATDGGGLVSGGGAGGIPDPAGGAGGGGISADPPASSGCNCSTSRNGGQPDWLAAVLLGLGLVLGRARVLSARSAKCYRRR